MKALAGSYLNKSPEQAAVILNDLLSHKEGIEEKLDRSQRAKKYFSRESMRQKVELCLEDLSIFGA